MKDLKLKIELVPKTAHYDNLRNAVTRSAWEKIAKETKERQGSKCGICGDQEHRLNCHERWEYDDSRHTCTLVGFISLCGYCHNVKHMGLTKIQARQGRMDLEAVIDHFCKVNGCTKAEYKEHEKVAFLEYHVRSEYEWVIDLGEYASKYIPRTPKARIKVIGFDTESYKTGVPFMFCLSDGTIIDAQSPNNLFAVLFQHKYRGIKFVCFNLKYDEGSILHFLPPDKLEELRRTNKTTIEGYAIRSIPKKELVIRSIKHKQSIAFYDIAQFYGMSLNKASLLYLGKQEGKLSTKSFSREYVKTHWSEIRTCSIYEAKLTQELADYFIDLLIKEFGIYPQKLYSTGYISGIHFSRVCSLLKEKGLGESKRGSASL